MTFKRIDDETVCCIVTEDDMLDHGLEVEDFLQNKEKVQDFLHKIVERAEEEVGYEAKKGILSMQVAMLPEHSLAITFSEKEDLGIKEMLNQMQKTMESIKDRDAEGFLKKFEARMDAMSEILEETQKGLAEEPKGVTKQQKVQENKRPQRKKERIALFEFDTLKDVIHCCQLLELKQRVKSRLLSYQDKYYLHVHNEKVSDQEFLKICGNAIEFGRICSNREARAAAVEEHGKCMIKKDAIQILSEI